MLPLEYITVGGLLRRTTALFPNRMAVIDREIRLTYREFDELTDRYATALLRQGVGRGDHVALFGEAEAEVLALFFASISTWLSRYAFWPPPARIASA